MHKAKIMYESNGLAENGKPFLTVKQSRGYYEYSERAGVDSIAFILYDANSKKPFALINESKPPLDEKRNGLVMLTTAFGGSLDKEGLIPSEICKIEVIEEAGYIVPLNNILFVGETLVSTQMSQMVKLFIVDVTDIEKTELTEYEQEMSDEQAKKDKDEFINNKTVWMDRNELIENNDWKSIFILTKCENLKII